MRWKVWKKRSEFRPPPDRCLHFRWRKTCVELHSKQKFVEPFVQTKSTEINTIRMIERACVCTQRTPRKSVSPLRLTIYYFGFCHNDTNKKCANNEHELITSGRRKYITIIIGTLFVRFACGEWKSQFNWGDDDDDGDNATTREWSLLGYVGAMTSFRNKRRISQCDKNDWNPHRT